MPSCIKWEFISLVFGNWQAFVFPVIPKCVCVFPYQQAVNSALTLSTWRQHQIPQVRAQCQKTPPTPHPTPISATNLKSSSSLVLLTNQLLGVDSFARAAHKTEKLYIQHYQFIIKGYDSRTTRWKRYMGGQGTWEGLGAPTLSQHATVPKSPCIQQPGSSPTLSLGDLWRLHFLGMID